MIVFAVIYGLFTVMAFIGNLLVLIVVTIYRSFHCMRYFLLASLALSDFLVATLITSNRMIVTGMEKWVFGTTLCHGSAYIIRVLHLSTVLHLCAVSYERYDAIVRNPLNYNGRITTKKAIVNVALLWVIPAVISFGPFFGWGGYVYDQNIFACGQRWDNQTTFPFLVASFVLPFGVILIQSYRVLKVVRRLQRGVKIIPLQLVTEEMSLECQTQAKGSSSVADCKQGHIRQEKDEQRNKNLQVEIQSLTLQDTLTINSSEMQGRPNIAYEGEPDEIGETSCKKRIVLKKRNAASPRCLPNKQCWENDPRRIKTMSEKSGCSSQAEQLGNDTMTPRNCTTPKPPPDEKSETLVQQQRDDSFPSYPKHRRIPLGKTQKRLAKLLKEGKAARDVMIIIAVFLLCYLPMWILACYRTWGGEPSSEAILSAHCLYATIMVLNPVIYSIRKKEFRKAVRSVLKLT